MLADLEMPVKVQESQVLWVVEGSALLVGLAASLLGQGY